MKKIISLFFVAGMLSLVSCGPSAEELKAIKQARLDSIAQVEAAAAAQEQVRLDSIAAVENAAKAEQARLDSLAAVEAAKKPVKGGKTTKPVVDPKAPKTGAAGRK